jgi:REP element-mobilizing transposase RayT
VHLLIQCDQQFGIHRAVKDLKGYTSRVLRQEFPHLKSRLRLYVLCEIADRAEERMGLAQGIGFHCFAKLPEALGGYIQTLFQETK